MKNTYRSAHKNNKNRRLKSLSILVGTSLLVALLLYVILPQEPRQMQGPPYVIALDAGHGGNDVGAVGLIQEIELTEQTISYLYDLLDADPNFTPILCREYGENRDVHERASYAKRMGAAVLLSVHGNADGSPETRGFECFPVPPGRTWHEESLAFAGLLAHEIETAGQTLRGEGGIRYLYYTSASEKTILEASQSEVSALPSFAMLEEPDCIAVLVEQCFITNALDVNSFAGSEGCANAAQAYYRAICDFFSEYANA